MERVCRAYSRPDVRLPTSATSQTDVRATQPGFLILAGTEASTSFLFSTYSDLGLAPEMSMRRAALRPLTPTPVLVPPTCVGLPNRDAEVNASPPKLASGCVVRIDVHGSKDRAKDASPEHMRDFSCLRRVHVLCGACATAFPSSAPSGHPLSSARRPPWGDTHSVRRTDLGPRSDDAPRRAPPSRRPGCLSPPRHVKESMREGI